MEKHHMGSNKWKEAAKKEMKPNYKKSSVIEKKRRKY